MKPIFFGWIYHRLPTFIHSNIYSFPSSVSAFTVAGWNGNGSVYRTAMNVCTHFKCARRIGRQCRRVPKKTTCKMLHVKFLNKIYSNVNDISACYRFGMQHHTQPTQLLFKISSSSLIYWNICVCLVQPMLCLKLKIKWMKVVHSSTQFCTKLCIQALKSVATDEWILCLNSTQNIHLHHTQRKMWEEMKTDGLKEQVATT